MRLTKENAAEYEGKTLDSKKRLFHYYPLRVVLHKTLGPCYTDRNGVMMKIPEEGVYFETVMETAQA